MSGRLKMVGKLLDKYIIPKYYIDIDDYELTSQDNVTKIIFYMDGTQQEIEEEIVDECNSVLGALKSTKHKFVYLFTTDGEDFYTYT